MTIDMEDETSCENTLSTFIPNRSRKPALTISNPVKNQLLSVQSDKQELLEIYDLNGKLRKKAIIHIGLQTLPVLLPRGFYIAQIKDQAYKIIVL